MDNHLAATATAAAPRVRVEGWRRILPIGWSVSPDASAAVGLLAASLVFYYPLVFLGRALVDYDAFVYFYPQRVFLARSLLARPSLLRLISPLAVLAVWQGVSALGLISAQKLPPPTALWRTATQASKCPACARRACARECSWAMT